MYFTGCMHVFTMAAISFERYYILKNPASIKFIDFFLVQKAIVVLILLSFFWSTVPLIGWSYYSLEDGLTSCSVEWKKKNFNVISYNFCIFIFVFIIPFTVIVLSNFKSFKIVSLLKCSESLQKHSNCSIYKKVVFQIVRYILILCKLPCVDQRKLIFL